MYRFSSFPLLFVSTPPPPHPAIIGRILLPTERRKNKIRKKGGSLLPVLADDKFPLATLLWASFNRFKIFGFDELASTGTFTYVSITAAYCYCVHTEKVCVQ
jgi:hypothetical protein